MYSTSAGGYCYHGPVKLNRRSNGFQHMKYTRIIKLFVLVSMIAASFTFGAMIQAYATNQEEDIVHPTSVIAEPTSIVYSVERGDTLWSIAKAYLPQDTDIRAYIADIKDMNGLKSSMLQEGQILQVPALR